MYGKYTIHANCTQISCAGDRPSPRFCHTLIAVGDRLVAFGGQNKGSTSDELLVLNTESNRWTRMAGSRPKLFGHSACVISGSMLVFGGQQNSDGLIHNRCYSYHIEKNTWEEIHGERDAPRARMGHAAASVGSKMYIFGGKASENTPLNDFHVYDKELRTWTEIPHQQYTPPGRWWHQMTSTGSRLIVHGGYTQDRVFDDLYVFDTTLQVWTRPNVSGRSDNIPPPLYSHTLCYIAPNFIICGGGNSGRSARGDWFVLDLTSWRWTWLRAPLSATLVQRHARFGQAAARLGSRVYILGGRDAHNAAIDDLLHVEFRGTTRVMAIVDFVQRRSSFAMKMTQTVKTSLHFRGALLRYHDIRSKTPQTCHTVQ
eukprot:TRINITY_DN595_c0_g1_i2.p1 TRINITY_DN595_c0_g1~~TRINITY_DN595_c0_g1_i2.p1  ORF type:complete len:371 (+),score=1.91 TRINITY_DN595_c0_g1_i2:262-1374(+)